ncbi:hypothetical protein C7N43_13120 [Sphingobacteriales bacterium UPWRP_1]|nr:hypothetical protein BVG80_14630 [Sphingobacteriales bacterium TSM_CSM]PSJ76548.1 hypothetical protein C7N43_13120 [Sphingobacteriales bacterium UPWRP_1]
MKDINHNFDNKVKRALENYEAPYQPDDWLLMDAMLDAAEESKRPTLVLFPGRRIIKLLFTGALFLVLAGAGIGYYQWQNQPVPPNNIASNMPPALPAEQPQGYTAAPASGVDAPKVLSSGANTALKTKNAQGSLSNTATQSKTSVTTSSKPAGTTRLTPQNQDFAAPPAAASLKTGAGLASKSGHQSGTRPPQTGSTPLLSGLYAEQANAGAGFAPVSAAVASSPVHTTALPAGTPTPANLKNTPEQLPQKLQSIKAAALPLPRADIQLPPPQMPAVAQPALTAAAPAPQFPPAALPRFSAGAYTAADANMLQENNHALAGISVGMQGTFRFARHWSIAAGAGFSYKKMHINIGNPPNYNQPAEPTDTTFDPNYANAYYNATLQMSMAVIPLTVQYHLLPGKKISPFAGIGYSVYLPYKNMLTYNRLLSSRHVSDLTSPQSLLANTPFTPDPRPVSGNNPDNDPLVDNPNIYDIEEETASNNNALNNYWVNSQPVYEANLAANTVNQQPITEANRPMFDVVHLELGMDYRISKHFRLSAVTRLSGTVKQHRFVNQPQMRQISAEQRLFTGSIQLCLSWFFK